MSCCCKHAASLRSAIQRALIMGQHRKICHIAGLKLDDWRLRHKHLHKIAPIEHSRHALCLAVVQVATHHLVRMRAYLWARLVQLAQHIVPASTFQKNASDQGAILGICILHVL